jgi:hypothetical protein
MAGAKKDELLERIQKAARYGRVRPQKHARESMSDRGASAEDVKKAILSATVAIDQPDEKTVRLEGGQDTDGDELKVVVAEDREGLRVVTVF